MFVCVMAMIMNQCLMCLWCSTQCRQRIAVGTDRCSSDSCMAAVMSYSSTVIEPPCLVEATYDVRVTLTDHTGSIPRCIVAGPVAEKMLGVTVQSFLLCLCRRLALP